MSDFQILRMSKSPFYKESHHGKYKHGNPQEKLSFYIPKAAYNDLMTYFKGNGLNLTDGFNRMVSDKLAMINSSRRAVFNNIEFIMLLPKTDDILELSEKARVIALYNVDCDFVEDFNHRNGFDKSFNYQYDLKPFGEGFFRKEMQIINSTKESQLRRINMGDLMDWKSLYSKLQELSKEEEWNLNLADCYFVRCPLNNYLDINRDGQFQSPIYDGDHEGIYIFEDLKRKYYCLITWDYSLENNSIAFINISFITMREFMEILKNSDFKSLRESYSDLKNSDSDKKKLESMIKAEEDFIDFLRHELDNM